MCRCQDLAYKQHGWLDFRRYRSTSVWNSPYLDEEVGVHDEESWLCWLTRHPALLLGCHQVCVGGRTGNGSADVPGLLSAHTCASLQQKGHAHLATTQRGVDLTIRMNSPNSQASGIGTPSQSHLRMTRDRTSTWEGRATQVVDVELRL